MKTKHGLWQLTVFSISMVLCVLLAAQEAINAEQPSDSVAITRGDSATATQTLTLVSGWNWVGFNVLPTSRTAGDVLGTTGFMVNDIIQTNGGSARFTGASWTPANFSIEFGKLYQIYVANAVTVNISGEPCPLWYVSLTTGWNWIGNLTAQHSVTPSELAHNGGWTENDRIQTAGGNSAAYINGKWIPTTGLSLEPGKGYQIYSANDGALAFPSEEDDDELYVVVDLSGGPDAMNYPVRYTNKAPNLNDDTCRTTELWLRKIPAGTFQMGWYQLHQVTITQDYYIGVFECTQKQWELVMGSNPSQYKGDCRPVEWVSYNMIRGTGAQAGAGWPTYGHAVDSTSFMGKLQAKTGLTFDLPTEAQWEYACRASTTTELNSGKDLTSTDEDAAMAEVGRYLYNQSDGKGGYSEHTKVGSYLRNAWGLYDMHGNVWEWCLDWGGLSTTSTEIDPVGPTTGSMRMQRGGSWNREAFYCCSGGERYNGSPSADINFIGFRIALHPKQDLYAVVDLSGGPDASSYPVRYTNKAPDLNDDTCRTTELWLRKIPAGTFIMGSPEDEVGRREGYDMAQHEVTLTQDFYIGVFECTQRQWELVMGTKPSFFKNATYYATRPVEQVFYNMIRGTEAQAGAGWPTYGHAVDASSFMGRLQAKTTGLIFDLPTEAQWEYACRAGTTTALNSGQNLTSTSSDAAMNEVGRYWYNGGSGSSGLGSSENCTPTNATAKVGSYRPNAWGLYDMHGNVWEWCLDWYGASTSSTAAEMDPAGPSTGSDRVVRGGYWIVKAQSCRSAYRGCSNPSSSYNTGCYGFRVVCLP